MSAREREMLARVRPGCVLLFARNCQTPAQVRELTCELRQLLGPDLLLAIDQEGGEVDRLRSLITPMPSAEVTFARGGLEAVARLGELTAAALGLLGCNFNLAPVLDLLTPPRRGLPSGLSSRTFGSTPSEVADCATAYLTALQAGGVMGCAKHFPGLGAATADPHHQLPVVNLTRAELEAEDLLPFRAIIDRGLARAVMVSHAAFPRLEEEAATKSFLPASLSRRITCDLLREQLRFDGVSLTDDLTMSAARQAAGDLRQAARRAVAAGHDLLLICAEAGQLEEAHAALVEAARQEEISAPRIEASLARLDRLRSRCAPPAHFDERRLQTISGSLAELRSQLGLTADD
jgi:beta-N-acetylhexosaminidase